MEELEVSRDVRGATRQLAVGLLEYVDHFVQEFDKGIDAAPGGGLDQQAEAVAEQKAGQVEPDAPDRLLDPLAHRRTLVPEVRNQSNQGDGEKGVPIPQPQVRRHHSRDEGEEARPSPRRRARRPEAHQERQNGRRQNRPGIGHAVGHVPEVIDPGMEGAEEDQRRDDRESLRGQQQHRDGQQGVRQAGGGLGQLAELVHGECAQGDGVERLAAPPVVEFEGFADRLPAVRRHQQSITIAMRYTLEYRHQQGVSQGRAPSPGTCHDRGRQLAVLPGYLESESVPCVRLRRVELGLKSLLRQVVGELVAGMVQEEEERGAGNHCRGVYGKSSCPAHGDSFCTRHTSARREL